jgi:predicted RecB family nuclease
LNFDASDIYDLYQPEQCNLRSRLAKKQIVASEAPNAFVELLRFLGEQHENQQAATLCNVTNLSHGNFGSRHSATVESVRRKDAVIYQPVLNARRTISDSTDFIVGIPDLLIKEGDEYLIRDCKLALRTTEESHPEILRQLNLYG